MNLLASVNMPAKHKPAQQRTPKHGKNGKGHSLDPETAKRTYHSWTCADLDTEQEKQKPYKKRYGTRHGRTAAATQQTAYGHAEQHYQNDGEHWDV